VGRDWGFGMRKLLSLGVMVVGIALIALSQTGALLPNSPCNDNPHPPAQCLAPFPWGPITAFFSGIVLLAVGLLYLRGGNRRLEVRAETRRLRHG
jgi:hypothetical protein